jgi:hypothetical protein
MSPSDRLSQLYPQAKGSFFIAYDSQGYGGGILTLLYTGLIVFNKYLKYKYLHFFVENSVCVRQIQIRLN